MQIPCHPDGWASTCSIKEILLWERWAGSAGQVLPGQIRRRNKKGPARGDERGQKARYRDIRLSENAAREEEGCNLSVRDQGGGEVAHCMNCLCTAPSRRTNAGSEPQPCILCIGLRKGVGWGATGQGGSTELRAKKEAPSEDGAYDLGPKSKSKVGQPGEGGGYACCRWIVAQGGGEGSDPVSQSRTEGGGNGAAHIDRYEYDVFRPCQQCGN